MTLQSSTCSRLRSPPAVCACGRRRASPLQLCCASSSCTVLTSCHASLAARFCPAAAAVAQTSATCCRCACGGCVCSGSQAQCPTGEMPVHDTDVQLGTSCPSSRGTMSEVWHRQGTGHSERFGRERHVFVPQPSIIQCADHEGPAGGGDGKPYRAQTRLQALSVHVLW